MGYVNNTAQYDKKYVRRNGKLYGTIDFEINENVAQKMFEDQPEKPVIGKLHIGGKTFDVTYQELDMIQRTLGVAKDTVNRKYKMGMMR